MKQKLFSIMTYLQAGSPTSLKKTHVPPFKQNAFPITGQGDPRCVQLFGGPKEQHAFLEKDFYFRNLLSIYSLVTSCSFGSTSIRIDRVTGCRANLFLARHSYNPESFLNADLIISSDLFLKCKISYFITSKLTRFC